NSTPCAEAQDPDCKCPPGHSCADEPCLTCLFCQRVPGCEPGHEPARIGKIDFHFGCKPCETGTYSSGRNGWCRNWTDCESNGFITLWKGNSTHNSVC
ncbi:TNR18 factor, partial [Daphoenositta chrysoptera]|nr:TNR18 factor [Daphoenositta chrysoptera]